MPWGPAYHGYYPAATVHHVQAQLQEWYKQQQQHGEFTHARPLISARASQQFAALSRREAAPLLLQGA